MNTVTRLCAMTNRNTQDMCKLVQDNERARGSPNAVAKCTTCDTDGCNGAAQHTDESNGKNQHTDGSNDAAQYGPIAFLVAFPIAIAKKILF